MTTPIDGAAASTSRESGNTAPNNDDDANQQTATSSTAVRVSRRKRKARHDESFVNLDEVATSSNGDDATGNGKKKKGEKKKEKKVPDDEEEFAQAWICSECKEAECLIQPDAEQLLICEGPCRRLAHYPCAGLKALPAENEPYICADCRTKRHTCSICQEYGVDGIDVFPCQKSDCGLFYHESCLRMQNVEVDVVVTGGSETGNGTGGDINKEQHEGQQQQPRVPVIHEEEDGEEEKKACDSKLVDEDTAMKVDEPLPPTTTLRFICPAHWCWVCTQKDQQAQEKKNKVQEAEAKAMEESAAAATKKKTGGAKRKKKRTSTKTGGSAFDTKSENRMIRCMECPVTYHITCIPPMARFHELAMLCHEHAATCKLPELDNEHSMQGTIEKSIDQRFEQLDAQKKRKRLAQRSKQKEVANKFFHGLVGDRETKLEGKLGTALRERQQQSPAAVSDELFFCLPCDVKDEVHAKPPPYRHIHSLQYDPKNRPARIPASGDVCQCVGQCGDDCINRVLYQECCGAEGGKTSNCNVGPNCGNRQLLQRKAAKCRVKPERGRGWGLTTAEDVRKGGLVHEYIGEVIDTKTKDARLNEWNLEHPNDPNFYIMALGPGYFVDARFESNLARFINHSCQPNCALLQINVGGYMRNGIFALRDLAAGEFLCYDYHFDTRHGDRFVCRCGAPKCRGTMKLNLPSFFSFTDKTSSGAGGHGGDGTAPKKITKSEQWEEARARYERDKRFLVDYYEDAETRCSLVDQTVPGADNNYELVANGPQDRYRGHRVFLWRNLVKGSDFHARAQQLEKKKKRMNTVEPFH